MQWGKDTVKMNMVKSNYKSINNNGLLKKWLQDN